MNKHKVKAYTIAEITITMLISAILIGITYTSYSIISKSYGSFNRKNDDMAGVVRLDELLKKDFDHAETVLKDSAGIAFKSGGRTIKYDFEPDYIIRADIRIDTFKVKTGEIKTLYESQPVNEVFVTEEANRLDELEVNIVPQNEKIAYHYHKQYSSANLMQRNPNALH